MRVGMVSLGCPKNQMDAELMLGRLREAGFELVADSALADIVIINTCGFIEDAKQESIDQILEYALLKKEGRIRRIIVTGCLAERYREELAAELPECDAVLGLAANRDIVEAVRAAARGDRPLWFPAGELEMEGPRLQSTPSFFAYLRIADGCNNRCTYCAIPAIRGRYISRPMENILQEACALAASGVRELILVAQDTTLYGTDLYGEARLPQLLEALCEIDGLRWIRFLYAYPEHITDELLDVMARQPKLVKYLDMPIQHASGKVLKAMNRRGDAESLAALVNTIREKMPDVTLRTTVMTGFPGETEEDFETLCETVARLQFDRLGCFAYSAEEGTPAADFPDQVEEEEKQRRRDIVMEAQARIALQKAEAMVGKTVEVLVESFDRYAECWFGRTAADAPDIDTKVFFTTPEKVSPGDFIHVQITECFDYDLFGTRV